jgi:PadR family transcriptional regulator PadR
MENIMSHERRLGDFEQKVLMALIRLGTNAYGMTIRQEISKYSHREVSVGAVYTTLSRLEEKGFVKSKVGEATPERGGRAKKYFQITAPGNRALEASLSIAHQFGFLKSAGGVLA